MKKIITYGTFDLLTPGHIALLKYAKSLGDYLVVGVSTDEFNAIKHKHSYLNYEERRIIMEAIRYVDEVIPEEHWEQKVGDIEKHNIDTLVMGSDWAGSDKFKYLEDYCNVVFFQRVSDFSSTNFRNFVAEHKDDVVLGEEDLVGVYAEGFNEDTKDMKNSKDALKNNKKKKDNQ